MEIIKNFGLDPIMLGAQILNFLIILFILRRFLYKPVLDLIKNREDTIKEGLKKAEESQRLLEKTQKEEQIILRNAESKAKKVIEDAKNQALSKIKESQELAKKQAEKLIEDARIQISQEAKIAEQKIMASIAKLSLDLLEKALSGLISQETQQDLMKKAIKQLQKKPN